MSTPIKIKKTTLRPATSKTPSFPIPSSRPAYPSIEELKSERPDIYQKYVDLADGTKLVGYSPIRRGCDEFGFIVYDIELSTRRDEVNRIIVQAHGVSGVCYNISGEMASFGGFLSGIDKAKAAPEGTHFKGWKRTNQYRLTKEEISDIVKGKIFKMGFF